MPTLHRGRPISGRKGERKKESVAENRVGPLCSFRPLCPSPPTVPIQKPPARKGDAVVSLWREHPPFAFGRDGRSPLEAVQGAPLASARPAPERRTIRSIGGRLGGWAAVREGFSRPLSKKRALHPQGSFLRSDFWRCVYQRKNSSMASVSSPRQTRWWLPMGSRVK